MLFIDPTTAKEASEASLQHVVHRDQAVPANEELQINQRAIDNYIAHLTVEVENGDDEKPSNDSLYQPDSSGLRSDANFGNSPVFTTANQDIIEFESLDVLFELPL